MKSTRRPTKCPVCKGYGVIGHFNPGDGMSDTSSECYACDGTGIKSTKRGDHEGVRKNKQVH